MDRLDHQQAAEHVREQAAELWGLAAIVHGLPRSGHLPAKVKEAARLLDAVAEQLADPTWGA